MELLHDGADARDHIRIRRAQRDPLQVVDEDAGAGVLHESDGIVSAGELDAALGNGDGGIVTGLAKVEAKTGAGAGCFERHEGSLKASSIASGSK